MGQRKVNLYKGIRIAERLNVQDLLKVIKLIPKRNINSWSIVGIHASGDISDLGMSMLELTQKANDSPLGINVSYEFFDFFLRKVESLDDILVLGGKVSFDKIDYNNPNSIYSNADYVIEYFDSTYWTISTSDDDWYEKLLSIFGKYEIAEMRSSSSTPNE